MAGKPWCTMQAPPSKPPRQAPTSIFFVRSRCPFSLPVAASCVRKRCRASGLMLGREASTPAAAELQARERAEQG